MAHGEEPGMICFEGKKGPGWDYFIWILWCQTGFCRSHFDVTGRGKGPRACSFCVSDLNSYGSFHHGGHSHCLRPWDKGSKSLGSSHSPEFRTASGWIVKPTSHFLSPHCSAFFHPCKNKRSYVPSAWRSTSVMKFKCYIKVTRLSSFKILTVIL